MSLTLAGIAHACHIKLLQASPLMHVQCSIGHIRAKLTGNHSYKACRMAMLEMTKKRCQVAGAFTGPSCLRSDRCCPVMVAFGQLVSWGVHETHSIRVKCQRETHKHMEGLGFRIYMLGVTNRIDKFFSQKCS